MEPRRIMESENLDDMKSIIKQVSGWGGGMKSIKCLEPRRMAEDGQGCH